MDELTSYNSLLNSSDLLKSRKEPRGGKNSPKMFEVSLFSLERNFIDELMSNCAGVLTYMLIKLIAENNLCSGELTAPAC